MPAKKKPVTGTRPKPTTGERQDQPQSANGSGRTVSVRSRRERFNRAGLRFAGGFPTIVKESEVGTDRFERILAEPQLVCTPVGD